MKQYDNKPRMPHWLFWDKDVCSGYGLECGLTGSIISSSATGLGPQCGCIGVQWNL